jgi:ribose transport system ATP-binding protein
VSRSLQTIHIRKEYPGTLALDDISVRFEGGKIHALIGKNGAGKSTLIRIFSGAVQPTSGQILVDGRPVVLRSPREAFGKGIATVYQELSLVPGLTVAENILLGRLPTRAGGLVVDWSGV